MRRALIALGLLALLALAPVAHAGGWATVGLSSTPAGIQPGQPWAVRLTILQHGITPLEGVKPQVIVRQGDETHTFAAKPTGKPGVYQASVVFPTAGTWHYEVIDGFISGRPHTFPPAEIGRETAPATSDGPPAWLAPGGIALLLASVALLLADRRRQHQPQAA